jgi:hypothetical protein
MGELGTFVYGETAMAAYENGIVVPNDFEAYKMNLWRLVRYVDNVIRRPDKDVGVRQEEITKLKHEVGVNIEDIDRFFEAGGKFKRREFKRIRSFLENRLARLSKEIPEAARQCRRVNAINRFSI